MLSPKLIMFMSLIFIVMSLTCLFLEGANTFGQEEVDMLNAWTGYTAIESGNVNMISLATGFFTTGLPKLITWDYSFFTGGWVTLRFILIFVFSGGILWGVFTAFINLLGNLLPW